jgi:hypothetical protein
MSADAAMEFAALKLLYSLAKLFAILAGLLLTLITLMTCTSLIGRNFLDLSLAGDFELTGVATGAAIALFMPYCQAKRGNIIAGSFRCLAAGTAICTASLAHSTRWTQLL